jgi:DNA-methyltransferase (dcm)
MRVLSLFDGISGAMVALKSIGIVTKVYYASEIDKYAIKVSEKNHPEIMRIGDVNNVVASNYKNFDLMVWGSPCQDLSIAKKDRKGLDGERSGLFWDALKIWKTVKPTWWLMENVASMPKEAKETISEELGVEPIMINSALVTAQNRKRLYWTNIPGVTQPDDRGILLKDIIENGETDRLKSYCIDSNYWKGFPLSEAGRKRQGQRTCIKLGTIDESNAQWYRVYSVEGKSTSLNGNGGGLGANTGLYEQNKAIRKLTPIECERLQGYPDNYTEGISNTQRYKVFGKLVSQFRL